jgi:sRNA-binding regulator protein Hfq
MLVIFIKKKKKQKVYKHIISYIKNIKEKLVLVCIYKNKYHHHNL